MSDKHTYKDAKKEWTLMFYFASDNPLAPNVVSQLKALKSAGFHLGVNVVLQFDPETAETPTHIFDVNKMNKIDHAFKLERDLLPEDERTPFKFWGDNDPFVRNLVLDKLWSDNKIEKPLRQKVLDFIEENYPTINGDKELAIPHREAATTTVKRGVDENGDQREPAPQNSLSEFLDFCRKEYPANHYMLFLLGHGLVVGHDMFLFDENAESQSLSLREFGKILSKFQNDNLELVGFHSCGLSGLEIASELQGTANYMIASQGSEFVGSWPYREILIRIFNDVHKKAGADEATAIRETIKSIFFYVLHSSDDFQLAGYSFDLCLFDLRGVDLITKQLGILTQHLTKGLEATKDNKAVHPFIRERILLAHWKAQSFWGEIYTDLYDFCFCLENLCDPGYAPPAESKDLVDEITKACCDLRSVLETECNADPELLAKTECWPIIRAEFAGPEYQYSRGLSVYFPWSRPASGKFRDEEYPGYRFNQPIDAGGFASGWGDFLTSYWSETRRGTIGDERPINRRRLQDELLEEITSHFKESSLLTGLSSNGNGNHAPKPISSSGTGSNDSDPKPISSSGLGPAEPKPISSSGLGPAEPKPISSSGLGPAEPKPISSSGLGPAAPKPISSSGLGPKPISSSGTGGGCDCPSIKNYPIRTFPSQKPKRRAALKL